MTVNRREKTFCFNCHLSTDNCQLNMEYRSIAQGKLNASSLGLGTWVFGGDIWWGRQDDHDSVSVLSAAIEQGINFIDTAPVYGRGRCEEVIGGFVKKNRCREKVILATKLGLSWQGAKISHNLSASRMRQELDESRTRLKTDYFDLYQVHWPDPNIPIEETARVMAEFYNQGIIKAIGVSNYSVSQMQEFMKYAPLHTTQPPYNMFRREIEGEFISFCKTKGIAVLGYIPLCSGILTGKFFFDNVLVPDDLCRRRHKDLFEPRLSINKETLAKIKNIAGKYNKTLAQLVLNWTMNRDGITVVLGGARNIKQLVDNLGSVDWHIEKEDGDAINVILQNREERIKQSEQQKGGGK